MYLLLFWWNQGRWQILDEITAQLHVHFVADLPLQSKWFLDFYPDDFISIFRSKFKSINDFGFTLSKNIFKICTLSLVWWKFLPIINIIFGQYCLGFQTSKLIAARLLAIRWNLFYFYVLFLFANCNYQRQMTVWIWKNFFFSFVVS